MCNMMQFLPQTLSGRSSVIHGIEDRSIQKHQISLLNPEGPLRDVPSTRDLMIVTYRIKRINPQEQPSNFRPVLVE